MVLPQETKTQLTELITPPNNQPVETSEVSADVVKLQHYLVMLIKILG